MLHYQRVLLLNLDCPLIFFETLIGAIVGAPINPIIASSMFFLSYARPIKFWEKDYKYVILCYIMLYYVILCYIMLYYVILYYVMLYYVILCYTCNLLYVHVVLKDVIQVILVWNNNLIQV